MAGAERRSSCLGRLFLICLGAALALGAVYVANRQGWLDRGGVSADEAVSPAAREKAAALASEPLRRAYHAAVRGDSQVYDGDTLTDVLIRIGDAPAGAGESERLWLSALAIDSGLYIQANVRIDGIDAAEMRPSRTNNAGEARSEAEREAEKEAAVRARDALAELLRQHNYELTLENIEPDKYGGRIVADALIGGIDAAQYLIQKRLAVPYDGGTKQDVDWRRLSLEGAAP